MKIPEFHLDDNGRVQFKCPHEFAFFALDDRWTVVQKEPLTVQPSVNVAGCVCHGFITNGVWVSCG